METNEFRVKEIVGTQKFIIERKYFYPSTKEKFWWIFNYSFPEQTEW